MREELIASHQIFIKKMVLKNVTGYEIIDNRDEYSIGLIAFNEAIDAYKPGFRSFQSFAAHVIKRRLIDYKRMQNRHKTQSIYLEDISELKEMHTNPIDQLDIKLEMDAFVEKLCGYGISLQDLINESPKHKDSRLLCIRMAMLIAQELELSHHFQKYKSLPLKLLLKETKVNPKTVERHRKYIIAISIILLDDMETLKNYIIQLSTGGESDGR